MLDADGSWSNHTLCKFLYFAPEETLDKTGAKVELKGPPDTKRSCPAPRDGRNQWNSLHEKKKRFYTVHQSPLGKNRLSVRENLRFFPVLLPSQRLVRSGLRQRLPRRMVPA